MHGESKRHSDGTAMRPWQRIALLLVWFSASCLLAPVVATTYGYASIWGSRSNLFVDYALPIPMATGTLHLPSLFVVGSLLAGFASGDSRHRRKVSLYLGLVFAVGVALLGGPTHYMDYVYAVTSPEMTRMLGLNRNPLALFVILDAVTGSLVTLGLACCIPARTTRPRRPSGGPLEPGRRAGQSSATAEG